MKKRHSNSCIYVAVLYKLHFCFAKLLNTHKTFCYTQRARMTARSLVTTKLGPVVGEQIISSGCSKPVHRFLGIPYAKAPVGQFRFRRPVPLDTPWSEPLQATQWPPQCPQFSATPFNKACEPYFKNSTQSEDCLKLNIWSPDVSGVFSAAEEGSLKRPVLVWIHGGGLVAGTASFDLYDGELFASEHDLVFVSFNYRLVILFVCT